MTSFIGMDVSAVRSLATQLNSKADEIETISNALSTQLEHVQWVGHDAEGFRSEWQGTHRTQLHTVATALRDAATKATNNANQQEQASAS
ncbi:hypothetical protein Lfu02_21780 [Longispora fulva]|uniref:Uncharacterized protein YukE n=1 Tax=Longispora fulva TaxID=619741 RepID=A0A8J7GLC1_9ACTN|nr:WXG100 family type VII secretion target [Longispora fulva]MBG6139810.1 uncharacterized protein YukE [Longispora fulva]GIG57806.1 hypothetical protein Lfu02_21780 [Longispora fulva]